MNNFPKCVGVVFDFDGVLVDSIGLHFTAWRHASEKILKKSLPDDLNQFVGKTTSEIASQIVKDHKTGNEKELAQEKWDYFSNQKHQIDLLPGVAEMFQTLKDLNIPFGIASAATHSFIQKTLDKYDLKVSIIIGQEDTPKQKPNPDPYMICAKRIGIDPKNFESVYVLEDSRGGLLGANLAQMVAVGIESSHPKEELIESGAKITYQHLKDALEKGFPKLFI